MKTPNLINLLSCWKGNKKFVHTNLYEVFSGSRSNSDILLIHNLIWWYWSIEISKIQKTRFPNIQYERGLAGQPQKFFVRATLLFSTEANMWFGRSTVQPFMNWQARKWIFATNSNFLIPISLQPNAVNVRYLVAKILGLENFSFLK